MTLIPSERLVNWTPGHAQGSGVPGGIPTGRTMYVNAKTGALGAGGTYGGTLAVGDGTSDDTAAINAMIAACPSDQYVYLPASSYKIASQIVISASNVSLRGAGVTTILVAGTNRVILVGPSSSATAGTTTVTNSAGLVAGSNSLTVGSTSGFSVGKLVFISPRNDATVPVLATDGRENAVAHLARIETVPTGTTFTFTPSLKYDMGGGSVTVNVSALSATTSLSGVEDLMVDGTAYGGLYSGVEFNNTYGCWVKGVTIDGVHNYPILFMITARNEARRNWASPRLGGGSSGGAVFIAYSTSALVEDNVLEYGLPIFQQDGNMANAISRNLGVGGPMNINHGPYNMFTLIEANAARGGVQSDGYFGGSRYDVIYNNYVQYVTLNRGSHDAVVVGNVIVDPSTKATSELFGFPNIANLSYSGTVTPPTTMWADFGMTGTLTTRAGNFSGMLTLDPGFSLSPSGLNNDSIWLYWNDYANGLRVTRTTVSGSTVNFVDDITSGDTLPPEGTPLKIGGGPSQFQEKDLGVEARMTRKGNRWGDNVFDTLGGDTLSNSLMYSSKPQWLTDAETELSTTFSLKPFDPVTPVSPSNSDIPAGLRYETLNPPDFSGASIDNTGTTIAISNSKPTTFGLGGTGGWTLTGGVTLTYSSTVGSTLYYTLSRTVSDEETFTISYVNPGNGVQDSNSNDLPNVTAATVFNGSQYAPGASWVMAALIGDTNSTTNLSNVASVGQYITIPQSGFITKVRIGVGSPGYTPNVPVRVALVNAAHSVLTTGEGTISVNNDYGVIDVSSVHVAAGTYRIDVLANSNAEPPVGLITGQPSGTSIYAFAGSFFTWPSGTIVPSGNSTVKYAFGVRLISDSAVGTPAFSPAAGTFTSSQLVTISSATVGATIRYTVDGSTPTSSTGTVYSGAISISATTTLKAIAYNGVDADSSVRTGTYTINVGTVDIPTFSPVQGTYSSVQSVTISTTTPGTTIRYTTNGSTPTSSSGTIYSGAISVGSTTTIKAIAYDGVMNDSPAASGTFTITIPTVATPVMSPAAGTYTSGQSVTISCATSGATIYYTVDGSTPNTGSAVYSGAITVNSTKTIKAIGVKAATTNSAVGSAAYVINLPSEAGTVNATTVNVTTLTLSA